MFRPGYFPGSGGVRRKAPLKLKVYSLVAHEDGHGEPNVKEGLMLRGVLRLSVDYL